LKKQTINLQILHLTSASHAKRLTRTSGVSPINSRTLL